MTKTVEVKILHPNIGVDYLKPATPGSAGIDLRAVIDEEITLYPGEARLVGTGIAIHIADPGYAGLILPRSGLGNKGLVLGNLVGLIDSDFSSEIKVSLWNRGNDRIKIEPMMRIAQLVIINVFQPNFNAVDHLDVKSVRGSFGSTGVD